MGLVRMDCIPHWHLRMRLGIERHEWLACSLPCASLCEPEHLELIEGVPLVVNRRKLIEALSQRIADLPAGGTSC